MNKYILYTALGMLTFGTAVNSYIAFQAMQRIKALEITNPFVLPTPPSTYPTASPFVIPTAILEPTDSIKPMPRDLPEAIRDAYTWPVMSLCDDRSGYTLYFQLDDGSNIYTDEKGAFVRGKKVTCTN